MLHSKTFDWNFEFAKVKGITGVSPGLSLTERFDVQWSEEDRKVTLAYHAEDRRGDLRPSVASDASFDAAFKELRRRCDLLFQKEDL